MSTGSAWNDWGTLGPIFWTSVRVVATIACVMVAGVALACFPRPHGTVQRPFMKQLARLCFTFFLPCMLITKIGKSFSVGMLQDAWVCCVLMPCWLLLSCCVGILLRRVAKPPAWFARVFVVGMTFQNAVGLPLIFMETLCEQPLLAGEENCLDRAVAFIFLSNLAWQLCLWTAGLQYLDTSSGTAQAPTAPTIVTTATKEESGAVPVRSSELGATLQGVGETRAEAHKQSRQKQASRFLRTCQGVRRALLQPPVCAMFLGIFIGLVAPLQDAFFISVSSPLRPVMGAVGVMADPYIGVVNLIAACSLGKALQKQIHFLRRAPRRQNSEADDASSTRESGDTTENGATEHETLPMRTTVLFVLGRLVVVPVTLVAICTLMLDQLPSDRVLRLVVMVVCIMPSANNAIVLCQLTGRQAGAEALATLYVLLYLFGLLTITAFTVYILATVMT